MGLWKAKFLREHQFRKFGAISLIAEARWYEKFRQFWARTWSRRTAGSVSLSFSPSFFFFFYLHIGSCVRYRIFASVIDTKRWTQSRTSVVNGAKTLRQIKKYGRGPMSRALARNYIRDFFPSIRRSSAMRHRLAELFPRKISAIFTRAKWHAKGRFESRLAVHPPISSFPVLLCRLLEAQSFMFSLTYRWRCLRMWQRQEGTMRLKELYGF